MFLQRGSDDLRFASFVGASHFLVLAFLFMVFHLGSREYLKTTFVWTLYIKITHQSSDKMADSDSVGLSATFRTSQLAMLTNTFLAEDLMATRGFNCIFNSIQANGTSKVLLTNCDKS